MKISVGQRVERIYPAACAVLLGLVSGFLMRKHGTICLSTFDTVMDDVIGVASILIGFLGAMVGIVFSLADNSKMKALMGMINQRLLKSYIEEPIVAGTLVIVLTIIFRVFTPGTLWQQALYLAMTLWLLLSFSRVIHILMIQCFIVVKPNSPKFIRDLSNEKRAELEESMKQESVDGSKD